MKIHMHICNTFKSAIFYYKTTSKQNNYVIVGEKKTDQTSLWDVGWVFIAEDSTM